MATEYEEWEQEEETYRRNANQELVGIDEKIKQLHIKKDNIIDEFHRWKAKHKRGEPPKTGYFAKLNEYIIKRGASLRR
jgi:hypothetical protein